MDKVCIGVSLSLVLTSGIAYAESATDDKGATTFFALTGVKAEVAMTDTELDKVRGQGAFVYRGIGHSLFVSQGGSPPLFFGPSTSARYQLVFTPSDRINVVFNPTTGPAQTGHLP
jgi:hypothetical protein